MILFFIQCEATKSYFFKSLEKLISCDDKMLENSQQTFYLTPYSYLLVHSISKKYQDHLMDGFCSKFKHLVDQLSRPILLEHFQA